MDVNIQNKSPFAAALGDWLFEKFQLTGKLSPNVCVAIVIVVIVIGVGSGCLPVHGGDYNTKNWGMFSRFSSHIL